MITAEEYAKNDELWDLFSDRPESTTTTEVSVRNAEVSFELILTDDIEKCVQSEEMKTNFVCRELEVAWRGYSLLWFSKSKIIRESDEDGGYRRVTSIYYAVPYTVKVNRDILVNNHEVKQIQIDKLTWDLMNSPMFFKGVTKQIQAEVEVDLERIAQKAEEKTKALSKEQKRILEEMDLKVAKLRKEQAKKEKEIEEKQNRRGRPVREVKVPKVLKDNAGMDAFLDSSSETDSGSDSETDSSISWSDQSDSEDPILERGRKTFKKKTKKAAKTLKKELNKKKDKLQGAFGDYSTKFWSFMTEHPQVELIAKAVGMGGVALSIGGLAYYVTSKLKERMEHEGETKTMAWVSILTKVTALTSCFLLAAGLLKDGKMLLDMVKNMSFVSMLITPKKRLEDCKQWWEVGTCRFGDNCEYEHKRTYKKEMALEEDENEDCWLEKFDLFKKNWRTSS